MLILNDDQVQHCQVVGNVAGKEQVLSGLLYQGNIFVKIKSYSKEEVNAAIKEFRQEYLDNEEEQIPSLIIKEETEISLWRQDNQFIPLTTNKIKPKNYKNTEEINFEQLVAQMRGNQGVKIKARHHKLKLYHRCFLGNEAVDWLAKNFHISRREAVKLGQQLIERKIIHDVLDESSFKDEPILYRFYEDEGKSIWTDKVI
ncbi:hypothetical protein IQ238_22210 [Pleurocapsales cyanobacterium LEGE 06147]|nr:hypothetical protein [Pleurocapsales cyanobacterium LEGE 06147]